MRYTRRLHTLMQSVSQWRRLDQGIRPVSGRLVGEPGEPNRPIEIRDGVRQ